MSSLLNDWQEEFLLAKSTKLAPKTLRNYALGTSQFLEHLGGKFPVTKLDILSFLNSLKKRDLSEATVSTYWRHISVFFNYLEGVGYIREENNPAKKIIAQNLAPSNSRKMPRHIDGSDITLFFAYLKRHKDDELRTHRDYALFKLLYLGGCRIGEATSLTVGNINIVKRFCFFPGKTTKNNEDRYIYFGVTLRDILADWLEALQGSGYKAPYAFPSMKGLSIKRPQKRPLRPDSANKIFHTICENAGIKSEYRLHDLRHTFTRNAMLAGIDLDSIRLQLGHKDTTMVLYYGQANREDQREAFSDFGDG